MRETADRPKARAEGVVVRELPGEVLVYDLLSHRAICLNETAGAVWRLCDGRTVGEIRRALEATAKRTVPEEFVWLALEQLDKDNLLDVRVTQPAALARMSRRELMRKVGMGAALALPVVASIMAPTPAQAASGCTPSGTAPPGDECAKCCTMLCDGSVCS